MKVTYYPKGTCSVRMDVEVDEAGIIRHVHVEQGCDGNLQGICRLVEGMEAKAAIEKLQGIRCGWKIPPARTSFPRRCSSVWMQSERKKRCKKC